MDPIFEPRLISLSQELLCNILSFLPIKDMLMMGMTCKRLTTSVKIYLQLCRKLDLCDTEVWGTMPESVSDDQLHSLLSKCPKLEALYGLRPLKVESRRLRNKTELSVLGIIHALMLCPRLKKVETNCFQLLEALFQYLPHIEIVGHFRNAEGGFPPDTTKQLKMNHHPLITCLHLTGVFIPELTNMPELKELQLLWVRFTKFEPFKSFQAPKLKTFVMKQCFGPDFPIRYMPLFVALSHAPNLERLECVRFPLPGGLIQRAVEESWDIKGFQNMKRLVFEAVKEVMHSDIGYLMIAACRTLEHVRVTPALMSDNFFASLHFAGCIFTKLKVLSLVTMDALWTTGSVSEFGMAPGVYNAPHYPAPVVYCEETSAITDRGVQIMGLLFPNCESLSLACCPHLVSCDDWVKGRSWSKLRHLTLRHCYCLKALTFEIFIESLKSIEVIILKEMFYEMPKGCSNVGLSVGTGLGLSSAVVTTRDERLAVNVPVDVPAEIIINLENDLFPLNNRNIGEHFHNFAHDQEMDDDDDDSMSDEEFNKHYEGLCNKPPEEQSQPTSPKSSRKRLKSLPADDSYSGPLTRNRERIRLSGKQVESNRCSQGTQTCHIILQRNMSQMWYAPCHKRCQCYHSSNSKDYMPNTSNAASTPATCDKSTSTNDPIYEEDKFQTVAFTSQELKSLTLMSTGLTSIHIHDTPALSHIEVQGCRVLREIYFHKVYKNLSRINVCSCPKFDLKTLLRYLQRHIIIGPTLIYFEPYLPRYSVPEVVETTLCSKECDIFFAVLYDYGPLDSNRAVYRENMLSWLSMLKTIVMQANSLLVRKTSLVEKPYSPMHRIYGEFPDGSAYELLTNNPILACLWRRYPNSIEICPRDDTVFEDTRTILSSLKEEIAEMVEARRKYRNICVGCYIRTPQL